MRSAIKPAIALSVFEQPSAESVLDSPGAWLSPVEQAREVSNESRAPPQRASNRGCLPMPQSDSLQLLDWPCRSLRAGKQGRIPPDLPGILDRLAVSPEGWLSLVSDFSRLFRRAAGTQSSLALEAERDWLQGVSNSRMVFRNGL